MLLQVWEVWDLLSAFHAFWLLGLLRERSAGTARNKRASRPLKFRWVRRWTTLASRTTTFRRLIAHLAARRQASSHLFEILPSDVLSSVCNQLNFTILQVQKKVSKKKVKSTKAATNKLDPKQRARLGLKNKMFKGKGAGVKRGGGKAKHAKKNRK